MSGAGRYLGPHIKTGPNSYEIGPVPIRALRLPTFNGSQGLYINTEDHRGRTPSKDKLDPLTPYIWDDFIGEHRANQSIIDDEYQEIFNRITITVSNEIEQRKQGAKSGQQLNQIDNAKTDQTTTINTIRLKEQEYQSQIETAHSLYGQNPFFLMKDLPFRKVVDGVNSVPPDLLGAYAAIDRAYRSALELKRLSLENNILASHLAGLAKSLSQAETGSQAEPAQMSSWLAERLYATNTEKDIRIQLLPHFLQAEIAAATGSVEGLTHSQSLEKYKAVIDNLIVQNQAAVGTYATANPNIQLPLSKPELESIKSLVHLQANTNLGKRWNDYHASLLHSESVRHLAAAASAFGELIARAKEAENSLEQIRLVTEAEARRVAAEQARIAAEEEARAEESVYKEAVSFLADTNKHILEKYGAELSKVAQDLQTNISGKKIRSYDEALASFEKINSNPNLKLNAKDTQAVVDALNALDKATFADNAKRLGKAFGVTGKIVQAEAIREKTIIGIQTGDWKPLGLEIEAIAAGALAAYAAGILLAGFFATIGSPVLLSVPIAALIIASAASYFDSETVDEINKYLINFSEANLKTS
ncbi:colicin-like pore-forming protein [Pseudomonas sp. C2B4]|uniref:colicin-like pore-forming protein n=1 Tax=Pseudomonas sp. C2B4 TaxID=2735270 RepID=UPI0015868F55|nr:colicin-like pore-forming protein [Pseudomonas sp. C2B4]NUU34422.1 hypothetical protein [Pseudomonas sp. C2B4]